MKRKPIICPSCHRSIWDHAPDCKMLEPLPEC